MKYTKESLSKLNPMYIYKYGKISDEDVDKVNIYCKILYNRSNDTPQLGDIIKYTTENGYYYPYGMVVCQYGKKSICCSASANISIDETSQIYLSYSGGPTLREPEINASTCIYKGKSARTFWFFGDNLWRADGGIYFYAPVSVWELNDNKHICSSKTHDDYTICLTPDGDYRVYSESLNSTYYFKETEVKQLQAFLYTYRFKIETKKDTSVSGWAYKRIEHHVSPSEYESIKGIEDTTLMNGMRKCKRVYDDKNFIVHTYYVWYWEHINHNFSEQASICNQIREHLYEIDSCSEFEYSYAKKELQGKPYPYTLPTKINKVWNNR